MGGFDALPETLDSEANLPQNEANAGESWYIVTLAIRMAQARTAPLLVANHLHQSDPLTSFLEPRRHHVADPT
jgi:hypothetical protein